MTQQTTAHVADYGNMLTTSNPILVDKVHGMGQSLAALAGSAQAGDAMSTQLLYGQISKLSAINGINDAFLIATILAGVAWVLSFFLQSGNKPNRKAGINFPAFFVFFMQLHIKADNQLRSKALL